MADLVPFEFHGEVAIRSDADSTALAEVRERIRDYLLQVAAVYDPIEERIRNSLTETRSERASYESKVQDLDMRIRAEITRYETAKRAQQLAAQAELKQQMDRAQEAVIAKAATKLALQGNVVAAQDLIANPPVAVLPTRKLASAAPTTTRHTFKLVDIGQVKEEYLKPREIDTAKVNAAARQHKEKLSTVVGEGVEYVQSVVPRRQSRAR